MTCKNCGKELNDDVRFCPVCGTEQIKEETPLEESFTATEATAEVVVEPTPKKWMVFSKMGKIFGIIAFVLVFIPGINLFTSWWLGIAGIVFSSLGKKAKTEQSEKNFKVGLALSIVALVLSIVMVVVYWVLMIVIGIIGAVTEGAVAGGFFEGIAQFLEELFSGM